MFRKIVRRFFKIVLYGFILSLIYLLLCKWMMPPVTFTQLSNWVSGYGLKRDYVSWNDIAPSAKMASIASEDQLFAVHGGFDWKALHQSLDGKVKGRPAGAAASTISQQTARNVFLFQGTGILRYIRKPFEAVYTKLIEWIWGKQRILDVYLNTIERGKGIFGIEAASQKYFNKPAKDLSPTEAALIISLLPDPKHLTIKPESHFVIWKSKWILRQMNNISDDKKIHELVFGK